MVFFYTICTLLYLKVNKKFEVLKNKKKRKKGDKVIIILVIILIIIAFFANLSRLKNGIYELSAMFLEYFGSCIEIMDVKIAEHPSITWGGLSFAGFLKYIDFFVHAFLKILGNVDFHTLFPTILEELSNIEEFVFIGTGYSNAFVTPFYYFFKDGHFIGVIILSFIWGNLSRKSYLRVQNETSIKTVFFYLLILFSVCFSMVRCWLASPEFAIMLCTLYLFVGRKKDAE